MCFLMLHAPQVLSFNSFILCQKTLWWKKCFKQIFKQKPIGFIFLSKNMQVLHFWAREGGLKGKLSVHFFIPKKKLPSSISIDPNWQQRWLTPAFAYPVGPSLLGCLRRGQPNSRHQSDPCDVSIYLTLSCHQMIFIFS